jgi:hypothetical protein
MVAKKVAKFKCWYRATEISWLQSLLSNLGVVLPHIPILWCGNVGTTYLAANHVLHPHMKHVEIYFHFVHDKVANHALQVPFNSTKDLLVAMAKGLSSHRFIFLRDRLKLSS